MREISAPIRMAFLSNLDLSSFVRFDSSIHFSPGGCTKNVFQSNFAA